MRLDQKIASTHGLTRNRAQQLIATWLVSIDGIVQTKSGLDISTDANICIKEDPRIHWVSRSAMKLDWFVRVLQEQWHMPHIVWANCLDIGSSTGGFTQVLLEQGATHVDAVDVGTAQLHGSLLIDARVTSYEQTDIRDFAKTHTMQSYDIIVCDVSFIPIESILAAILSLARDDTDIVLLFKPQFEVGRSNLRKTGVPRSDQIIQQSRTNFEKNIATHWANILFVTKSTLLGEAGNQEWLYLVRKT